MGKSTKKSRRRSRKSTRKSRRRSRKSTRSKSTTVKYDKIILKKLKDMGLYAKTMAKDAYNTLNLLVNSLIKTIISLCGKTISISSMGKAIKKIIPGELGKHAISQGSIKSKKPIIPISDIRNNIHDTKISTETLIYLTIVVEYILDEIIEMSAMAAEDHERSRISSKDITISIENDKELKKLEENISVGYNRFSDEKSFKFSSKRKYMTEARCKEMLKDKIRINMNEYKSGRYTSRGQAVAVAYSQVSRMSPSCKKHLKRVS